MSSGTVPEPEAQADSGPPEGPPHEERPAAGDARPLGVGTTPTGHPGVDAGLRRLTDVDHLAVGDHPEVYEDVHRGLRDTLTALDRQPGPPVPGAPHDTGS